MASPVGRDPLDELLEDTLSAAEHNMGLLGALRALNMFKCWREVSLAQVRGLVCAWRVNCRTWTVRRCRAVFIIVGSLR